MAGPPSRPLARPWTVVALCCAVIGIGAGPGFLLGYVAPALMRELEIGRVQVGLLVGLFFGSTGLTSMLASRMAGPLGARACLLWSMGTTALTSVAMGLLQSFGMLALLAVIAGAGYAFGNVGTNMAVVRVVGPSRAASALTVKTAGVPLVATILALIAGLIQESSWRPLPLGLSVAALIAGALTLRLLPSEAGRRGTAGREANLHRAFWLLPLAAFLFISGSQPLQSFLLTYLHEGLDVSVESAGTITAVGTMIGVVSMVLVARLADVLGSAKRAWVVSAGCLLGAIAISLLLGSVHWTALAVVGAVIGLSCNLAVAGLSHAVVVDRARDAVGRASGFALVGYYLGALVSPLVFGYLVDTRGGYAVAWGVCAVLLVLAAVTYGWAHRVVPLSTSERTVRPPQPGPAR